MATIDFDGLIILVCIAAFVYLCVKVDSLVTKLTKVKNSNKSKTKNFKTISFDKLAEINVPIGQLPGVIDFDTISEYIKNGQTLTTTIQYRTDAVMKIYIDNHDIQIFIISLLADAKPILQIENDDIYNQLQNYFYKYYSKLNCNVNSRQLFAYPRLELIGNRLHYKVNSNNCYSLLTITPGAEMIVDNGIFKTKINNDNWTLQSYPLSMHQYIIEFLVAKTNILYIPHAASVIKESELPAAIVSHNCPSAHLNVCH